MRALTAVTLYLSLVSATSGAHSVAAVADTTQTLERQMATLSPAVRREEAVRLANRARAVARELNREYRPLGPPQFHNFLVNAGLRERGLCHHWTRDLGSRLAALRLRTLVLRWGSARPGTLREHNAVVVTARGQPFEDGIVLDPWRHSGRLFFARVANDKYPWEEDPRESFTAGAPSAAANARLRKQRLGATLKRHDALGG